EDFRELEGRGDLELVVATVARALVRPPPQEDGGVAKATALQVIVLHLADELDPQRLPRQILAGAPPALAPRHACERGPAGAHLRPVAPWVVLQGAHAQRCQLPRQLLAGRHRKRGRDAYMLQHPFRIVEPEQERPDAILSALVPAKSGNHAIGRANMLHL